MADKVLLIGSGGREHALALALARSPQVAALYIAPGNAGTAECGTNVPIGVMEHEKLLDFIRAEGIDFVVVGPDDPLAAGIVDTFEAAGIPCFGPTKAAAELEWSKIFAKHLMQKLGVPTAHFAVFDDYEAAHAALAEQPYPLVIKADGLALGKGVSICPDQASAEAALQDMMCAKRFGAAGSRVLFEECLSGPECSLFLFSDGEHVAYMPVARDHKRAYDHDEGPNTGGMGAVAPAVRWSEAEFAKIRASIVEPTLQGMRELGRPYKGVLYIGLMLCADGPKVIEFNARFGDPEAQTLLPLLKSDLYPILRACQAGTLEQMTIEWSDEASACVILASGGYPGSYAKGLPISGLDEVQDALVYHAGTARNEAGEIVTNGGRVLAVVATAPNLDGALARAYAAIEKIHFKDAFYRHDIGANTVR